MSRRVTRRATARETAALARPVRRFSCECDSQSCRFLVPVTGSTHPSVCRTTTHKTRHSVSRNNGIASSSKALGNGVVRGLGLITPRIERLDCNMSSLN